MSTARHRRTASVPAACRQLAGSVLAACRLIQSVLPTCTPVREKRYGRRLPGLEQECLDRYVASGLVLKSFVVAKIVDYGALWIAGVIEHRCLLTFRHVLAQVCR